MIETTANLDYGIYEKIMEAAEANELKVRHIVHGLFRKLLVEMPVRTSSFSRVKYQDRVVGRKWKKFRLRLSEGVYEGCIDLRKLHKYSVSFMLDLAVKLYLGVVVEDLKGEVVKEGDNPDNYPDCFGLIRISSPGLSFYVGFHLPPPPELIEFCEKFR